ncbi:MAG: hypothetical protein ACJAYN_000793 [Bermanella sp.]|jgi:hypothetical protein
MGRATTVLIVLLLIVIFTAWYKLLREVDTHFEKPSEHFKYGSIGVEAASGVPLNLWQVLPQVCEKNLPNPLLGYKSFGFNWEPGKRTPVGMPIKTIGIERVGINCALCHTAQVRFKGSEKVQQYLGAPSPTIDLQGYLRFLQACGSSPEFTPENIIAAINQRSKQLDEEGLGWLDTVLYKTVIVPQGRKALIQQAVQTAWMAQNPNWGLGRQDPFNPAKTTVLRLPFDGSVGNSKIPAFWRLNAGVDRGRMFHWDGLNKSLQEVFINSGIGNGSSNSSLNMGALKRIKKFAINLEPPPFPFAIKPLLAAKGEQLFTNNCAGCHSANAVLGKRTYKPVALAEIGTDPERLGVWSQRMADVFNAQDTAPKQYDNFVTTGGYVATDLSGIWLLAPYLHNGSVPNLHVLLSPPTQRPKVFYTGYNVYDPTVMGYDTNSAQAQHFGFKFDTAVRGNANSGHYFGTTLNDKQKLSLIEYLKTL